jgi:hypothetical protein
VTRRALFAIAALGVACHDWSDPFAVCLDAGICALDGGSGGGTSAMGGGTTGTGGGTASTGGGTTSTGGGTGNTGGGTSAAGGGETFGPWALQAMPAAATIGNGGVVTTTIAITRPSQTTTTPVLLKLGADDTDAGIAAFFFENDVPAFIPFTMNLRAPFDFDAGTYAITINATYDGGILASTSFSLTVLPPSRTLLVDGDRSLNNLGNGPVLSKDDAFFVWLLDHGNIPHDTFMMPFLPDGGLTPQQLNRYDAVVWSAGYSDGTLDADSQNEQLLQQWLDQNGKKLILVSQYYSSDVSYDWTTPYSSFAVEYLGLTGGKYTPNQSPYTVMGVPGTALEGLSLDTIGPASGTPDYAEVGLINLDGGRPLMTLFFDPDGTGAHPTACAAIKTGAGGLHSSTFEYVGVPLPMAADADAGFLVWEALRTAASWP